MRDKYLSALIGLGLAMLPPAPGLAQDQVRVVASLPTYGAIAREIVGDRGEVKSIARGDENPHFVRPKPSYVVMLKEADVFVTTGLDLELWVPTLLDKANNRKIKEGGPGYVTAYTNVRLLDVPAAASREAGDIHIYGNPHIHTDPINAIVVSRNILVGLERASPENAEYFAERQREFELRVLVALFGDELLELLGRQTLFELANSDGWWKFLSTNEYDGRPLTDYVGGWLAAAAAFRGREMVCYHMLWAYFTQRFQVACSVFVESKPGIPPSPRHVEEVLDIMNARDIPAVLAANFWDARKVRNIAERGKAEVVFVPEHVGGEEGIDTYFELVDAWVARLDSAFSPNAATGGGR